MPFSAPWTCLPAPHTCIPIQGQWWITSHPCGGPGREVIQVTAIVHAGMYVNGWERAAWKGGQAANCRKSLEQESLVMPFSPLVGLPCVAGVLPQTMGSLSEVVSCCHPLHGPPGPCRAGLQGHGERQSACVHANACHRAGQNGMPRGQCHSRAAPSGPASAAHLHLLPIHM